jgi:regulator of replication initiation timing
MSHNELLNALAHLEQKITETEKKFEALEKEMAELGLFNSDLQLTPYKNLKMIDSVRWN